MKSSASGGGGGPIQPAVARAAACGTRARWRRSSFARRRINFSEELIDCPVLAVWPRVVGPRHYECYEGEEPEEYHGNNDDNDDNDDNDQYDPDVSF